MVFLFHLTHRASPSLASPLPPSSVPLCNQSRVLLISTSFWRLADFNEADRRHETARRRVSHANRIRNHRESKERDKEKERAYVCVCVCVTFCHGRRRDGLSRCRGYNRARSHASAEITATKLNRTDSSSAGKRKRARAGEKHTARKNDGLIIGASDSPELWLAKSQIKSGERALKRIAGNIGAEARAGSCVGTRFWRLVNVEKSANEGNFSRNLRRG